MDGIEFYNMYIFYLNFFLKFFLNAFMSLMNHWLKYYYLIT